MSPSKKPTPYELRKKAQREMVLYFLEHLLIYVSVVLGVLLTESVLDIQQNEGLVISFSWVRVGVAAIMSMFVMSYFETGVDKIVGKNRKIFRRVSHAFSQGAALRGMIEWLFLLFTLTR